MLESLAKLVAGLGLFFVGMSLLTDNLKRLTGRRFRETVAAWTRHPVAGLGWGVAAGAVMQSSPAVTFVLVSMIATGLMPVRAALPIILGCNTGTSLLVLIAALDLHVLTLLMLGVAGLAFTSDRFAPIRGIAFSVFGIGLLFLGLGMLRVDMGPLADNPVVRGVLNFDNWSYLVPFFVALAASVIVQSSNSITILVMTLAHDHIFSFDQAVMAIYGSNVGGSALTFLLATTLTGPSKQVAMFQVAFNIVTALVLVPLYYAEIYGHVLIVRTSVEWLTPSRDLQMAAIYIVFNIAGAVILMPFTGLAARFLARRYPPPADADDAKPAYLHDLALQEPVSALDLAVLEQKRLAGFLPRYIEFARQPGPASSVRLGRQHAAFVDLSGTVQAFLQRLTEAGLDHQGYERLTTLLDLQRSLEALEDTLRDLVDTSFTAEANPVLSRLTGNLLEGVDAVLRSLVDALGRSDEEDRLLFRQLTGDRGPLMQHLRAAYLAADEGLDAAQKAMVLTATSLAERVFWLLDRIARHLPEALPAPQPVLARAGP